MPNIVDKCNDAVEEAHGRREDVCQFGVPATAPPSRTRSRENTFYTDHEFCGASFSCHHSGWLLLSWRIPDRRLRSCNRQSCCDHLITPPLFRIPVAPSPDTRLPTLREA